MTPGGRFSSIIPFWVRSGRDRGPAAAADTAQARQAEGLARARGAAVLGRGLAAGVAGTVRSS
jgi:hypothetical protein